MRSTPRTAGRIRATAPSTPRGPSAGAPSPPPRRRRSSRAPLISRAIPVEVTVRFSNASGDPHTSDAHPIAGRGMAVKFHLPDGSETDIVSVPLAVFMVRTPEDFLAFTRARIPNPETGHPDAEKLGAFLGEHPETGIAIQKGMGKLAPTTSFATSDYRALHAFCLIDADGGKHWGRYTWEPEEGTRVPDATSSATRPRATTSRRRSASGSARASPGSPWSSRSRRKTTRSTTRPTNGRASARWSSSASSS